MTTLLRTFFGGVARAYDYVFATRRGQGQLRATWHSALLAVGICAICVFANRETLRMQDYRHTTGSYHAGIALEIAINRRVCGTLSDIVDQLPPGTVPSSRWTATAASGIRDVLRADGNDDDLVNYPLLSWPARMAGSRDAYCRKVTWPYQHNENSLMLIESAILRVRPGITLRGLGFVLSAIRVGCIAVLIFFILQVGGSPMLAACLGILAMFTTGLDARYYRGPLYYAYYPFFMPFTVLYAALLGLALRHRADRHILVATIVFFVLGLYAGLFVNMRSSYLPLIFAGLLTYLAFTVRAMRNDGVAPWRARLRPVGMIGAGFLTGMLTFHLILIRPMATMEGRAKQIVYHNVFHPLVLALALPENDLAKREGIKWDDSTGMTLARTIDRNATWDDYPRYEKVLASYYFGLWRKYPTEMRDIYVRKLKVAGYDILRFMKDTNDIPAFRNWITRTMEIVMRPWTVFPNGIYFVFVFAGIFLAGYFLAGRGLTEGGAFALSIVALFGLLLLVEAAMIREEFTMKYQDYLLVAICFCGLVVYQAAADILSFLLWLPARRRALATR
jgi:hypothetical protein